MTGIVQISDLFARFRRLAWLPVPLYIALIAILYTTLPPNLPASLVFDQPQLMLVLNTVFLFGVSCGVSVTAMRAYVASGSSNILLLGCGVLAPGMAALAGGWIGLQGGDANTSVTIFNVGGLLGAILNAMGALLTLLKTEPEQRTERRWLKLLSVFGGTLVLIAVVIAATLRGTVPLFWVEEVGPTPIRQVVLGMTVVLFALTSIYTLVLYFKTRRYFLWWYSLALALTAVGVVGLIVMKDVGGPLGWAGRTAQYLGGVYFLIATVSAFREARSHGLTLEMAIDRFYRRSAAYYRDLVDAVSEAIISIDERKRVLLWSQGAEKMLGYTWREAAGCSVSDLVMPEGHKERLDDELQNVQRENVGPFASKGLEIEMRKKDGTLFPSDTSLSLRRIGSGWIATLVVRDVTERKRAEQALRQSQQLFSSIFRSNPAATILSWWADGRCIDANEAYAKLVGYTREELIGKTTVELNIWISAEERQRVVTELAQKGHLENVELTLRKKNGELVSTVAGGEMFVLDGQQYILSFFYDITERKRMEEALRESEEKYRTLVEQSLQGTWVIQDMRVAFCNQTFANMGGWAVEEVCSFSPEEVANIIHPDDQKRVWGRFRERLEGKQLPLTDNQLRAFRKDGSIAWIEYDARRINYRGRPAMLISVVDITERRKAEKALRESEQRYRQLAESAEDSIFIIDREAKIQYINSFGAKEFACDPDQMLGKSVMDLFPPDTAKRQWGSIQKVIQSGHAFPNIDSKVIFPGRKAWLNTSLVPLRTESGEVNQVLGIARDVTEFKQADEALRESEKLYRQLSEENARLLEQSRQDAQTKTTLLHEVNHRVKNNLASIIGLIQAQERFRKNEGSPVFRTMCRDLAGRVQGLAMAHNLLSAAGWSSVKLSDLATEVIHSTLQILPPDQRTSVRVSPSSTQVSPDQANTLALVINELATNTIKHGQPGNQALSISVRVEESDGQILFEFRDNGSGYPEPIFHEEQYNVGLHLVTNLVLKDLRGKVTLRNDHGAVTRIQFEQRKS